jgi:hypothetical protein
MKPRSINIFLLDGDPNGIRVAQIMMSTIQAIAFRRNKLGEVRKTFPEIERPGITRQPRHLWIIPAKRRTPRQFKPDGAVMPPKKPTDLTQARSPPMFRQDHATFFGIQVLVVSFHGNILCPPACRCRTSILRVRTGARPSLAISVINQAYPSRRKDQFFDRLTVHRYS